MLKNAILGLVLSVALTVGVSEDALANGREKCADFDFWYQYATEMMPSVTAHDVVTGERLEEFKTFIWVTFKDDLTEWDTMHVLHDPYNVDVYLLGFFKDGCWGKNATIARHVYDELFQ